MTARLVRLMPSADSVKLCAAALIVMSSSYRVGLSVSQHHYATGGLVLLAGGLCWQWMILRRRAGRDVTQSVAGLLKAVLAVAEPAGTAMTPSAALPPGQHRRAPVRAALKVRSVFISDVHLGMNGCQAEALADFLRHFDPEALFLVGDIVDGWSLRSRWYWPPAHEEVLLDLLDAARSRRVVYLAGNHDEFLRQHSGANFARVEIAERVVHRGADGRNYLVVHGDQFDAVVRHARWLALVGDFAYRSALVLNRGLNQIRRQVGKPYWSFSAWAKLKVKGAVNYISSFEEELCREARRNGAQGVICGHIHHAAMHDRFDVRYINTGDWVESCSAVVEHHDGRFEIVRWADRDRSTSPTVGAAA